jgi:Ca2+-binding RTX toxin-like protein
MPRLAPAALAAVLVFAFPAAARAATLVNIGGTLTYSAAGGRVNALGIAQTGADTVTVTRLPGDTDSPVSTDAGCSASGPVYTCGGVSRVSVDAGDGNDTISAAGLATIPAAMVGGAGADTLTGGGAGDALDGEADNDSLNGGGGDDVLSGDGGADSIVGGDGIDLAVHAEATPSSYTIDGVANDGAAGEGDDIATDVENVTASAAADGTVSLAGSAGPNQLVVTQGKGTIVGGAGADVLEGGPQDDVVDARDGTADVVTCGGGSDTVLADTVDTVSPTCEAVQRFATPGGADDDHAPALK